MTYEAWRISYQSTEQAARAAYEDNTRLRAELDALRSQGEPVGEHGLRGVTGFCRNP